MIADRLIERARRTPRRIAFPESADLGAGVYLRPTVVGHPGEGILEICNRTAVGDLKLPGFFQAVQ